MTCEIIGDAIVCFGGKIKEVVLESGKKFWFEHHAWSGAIIWADEYCSVDWDNWWDDKEISAWVDDYYTKFPKGVVK